MDQSKKAKRSSISIAADSAAAASHQDLREEPDVAEEKNHIASRKVQKADREKLRRDRLNEHFLELGNALDPDRPKNDKATILADTAQMLKDLMAEVNRLKAEYTALTEEFRELTQEKNELRDEKASLRSDIERLNAQYQQRVRMTVPWTPIEPSVVISPQPYSYPVPIATTAGPISTHPQLQPFCFSGCQNPSALPNACSTFIPYPARPPMEQVSVHHPSSPSASKEQDSKSKSLTDRKSYHSDNRIHHNDVATELELKTPGSSAQKEISAKEKKGKQAQQQERSWTAVTSSLSMYSSPRGTQDNSSSNMDVYQSLKNEKKFSQPRKSDASYGSSRLPPG